MVRINQHYQNINAPIRIRSHNIEQDNLNLISYRNELRQYNSNRNSNRNSNIIREVDNININLNLIRDNIFNEYISEIEPNEIDSWIQPPQNPPTIYCGENSSLPSYDEILPPPMYVKKIPTPKLPSYSPPALTQAEINEINRLKIVANNEKERKIKRENIRKKNERINELNLDKESIDTHWDGFGKFCNGCLGGMVFTGGLSLAFIPIGFIFCGGYFCGKYIKYKIKKNIYKLL
jgi:hypothetical protein